MEDYANLSEGDLQGLIDETPVDAGDVAIEGQTQTQAQKEAEYEYAARGKTIKEPISKILERASRGYDYAELVSGHKQKEDAFNAKFGTYVEIDRAAQENPEWWNHVMNSYQSRGQQQAPELQNQNSNEQTTALPPEFQKALGELQELKSWKQEFDTKQQQEQAQKEDQKLDEEITSVFGTYKNIDFKKPDNDGKSLEYKVLEHMRDNGIKSFKTAFRDFYHDHLIKHAEEGAKEKLAKDFQGRTKLGLLGTAPKELTGAKNHKSKSYDDLANEALRELGIN